MLVDLLLLLVIATVSITGFFQGTIKLVLAILILYASMLLASLYFKFLALSFAPGAMSPILADTFSFLVLLLVCFGLLYAGAVYTFRYVRLPERLEILDRVLGAAFGLLLGVVVSCILAMLLRYAFIDHDLATQSGLPFINILQQSTRRSNLLPVLLRQVLPSLYTVVSPWLPDTALPLFVQGR